MSAAQLNAFDPKALGDLKRLARQDNSPETLRAASKQFEALFMQMVMKSMREATPQGGLFDNEQTKLFQSMLDQQLSMNMSQGRGVGLADAIFRQLGGENMLREAMPGADKAFELANVPRRSALKYPAEIDGAAVAKPQAQRSLEDLAADLHRRASQAAAPASAAVDGEAVRSGKAAGKPRDFVERVWEHAKRAAEKTGIPAHFMVAQAALETGWGKAEMRSADGTSSYNLFNIKAGANWKGPVVERTVTEYDAKGRAYTEKAKFRAYGSYEEAFQDYARLIGDNPRYANLVGERDSVAFARGLQRAGYATDPMYADKLARIIGGKTLRSALSA